MSAAAGKLRSGRAGANVYCSFQSIQAFASHCDLHEVFALQCEGEKVWNIYENRAASPVVPLEGEDAQRMIDASKGRVMMQVTMRPGDLLYIPRGFYHDALASSVASLHITLSVLPLTGRILFRMLEEEAMAQEAFRRYLPDARLNGGGDLAEHLSGLGEQLAGLMSSPGFQARLGNRQRQLPDSNHRFTLPQRLDLEFYARTQKPATIQGRPSGPVLLTSGAELSLDGLAEAAEWLLNRAAFSVQEMSASFSYNEPAKLRDLVARIERMGLILRYTPQL